MLGLLGVGLVSAIVVLKQSEPTDPAAAVPVSVVSEPQSSAPIEEPTVTEGATNAAPAGPQFHWSQVESEDFRIYIKNLAATGCPKRTINDIIIAELNLTFDDRETPLRTQIAGFKSKSSTGNAEVDVANTKQEFEMRKQLRTMEEEKQKIVKDLLGVEIALDPIRGWHPRTYDRYESTLNTLPAGKRELVRQIQESYWETSDQLNDKYQLRRTPEYLEEYRKINADRKAQLEQALSPQEAADYEMRISGIASKLGTALSGTGVSSDEFREIFALKNGVEAPYGGTVRVNETEGGETPEYLQNKQEAEKRIAEILGPERCAAYQMGQDPNFQRFADLGDRYGVNRDILVQAYRFQQQFPGGEGRRNGVGMSPENQEQYDKGMRELLGDKAFEALQRGQNFSSIDQILFP
jgi:hypothetical protein